MRRSCENYANTKSIYKNRDIISKLSKNNNISIMKQDKGRGIVIMDREDYHRKCIDILSKDQFKKLDKLGFE